MCFVRPASHEQLIRDAKGLVERGYVSHIVDTVAEARRLVHDLLPRDRSVFTETLRLSGLRADIDDSGEFQSLRAELSGIDPADIRTQIKMDAGRGGRQRARDHRGRNPRRGIGER